MVTELPAAHMEHVVSARSKKVRFMTGFPKRPPVEPGKFRVKLVVRPILGTIGKWFLAGGTRRTLPRCQPIIAAVPVVVRKPPGA